MTVALLGKTTPGQFDSEATVTFKDFKGRTVSLIAPTSKVQGQQVTVRVLATEGDFILIELPGEVFGGGREVTVHKSQIRLLPQ
jgi:hypothetical protein